MLLSLLSPSPSPFLNPSPPFPLLLLPPTLFFGISESKHFLHIKMWNSFWQWAGNRVELAICPCICSSLSLSPSFPFSVSVQHHIPHFFPLSIHGSTFPPHFLLSPKECPVREGPACPKLYFQNVEEEEERNERILYNITSGRQDP